MPNSALGPVVHGDIVPSINTQYNTHNEISSGKTLINSIHRSINKHITNKGTVKN